MIDERPGEANDPFVLSAEAQRRRRADPADTDTVHTLSVNGQGDDLARARALLRALDPEVLHESVEVDARDVSWREAIGAMEDYKLLDVEAATMTHALRGGIRRRYPGWIHLLDGDGGDALTMIELDHLDRLVSCAYPFLGDIARFEPWSMRYFSAATSGEQALRAGRRADTGFALAGETAFAALVERAVSDQPLRGATAAVLHEQLGRRFAPWNRAGLWDPARGGIYPFIEARSGDGGVTSAS